MFTLLYSLTIPTALKTGACFSLGDMLHVRRFDQVGVQVLAALAGACIAKETRRPPVVVLSAVARHVKLQQLGN